MQVYLSSLIQTALLILVIAIIVAAVQIVIILVDVRRVTKRLKRLTSSLDFLDYVVDSEDFKYLAKKLRRAIFSLLEILVGAIARLAGGGEKK
jgi:hypothetical protein